MSLGDRSVGYMGVGSLSKDSSEHNQWKEEANFFLNTSVDLICKIGFDSKFKMVNQAWEETLGWSEKELVGKPYTDFIHPDDLKASESARKKHDKTGKIAAAFENRYRCKDGSYKWLSWNVSPQPDHQFTFAIARDITERKKTEDALRESEESLKEAQQIALMGSWSWDLKTDDVVWSDNLCLMHGMKPAEFDGKFDTVMSFIHPDDLGLVQQRIQKLLDGKKPIDFEYRIITINGDVKIVQGHQKLTLDDEGNIVRMVGIIQDITELKKAEDAIKESEEKWRSLSENSPDYIMLLDTDFNIIFINQTIPPLIKKEVIGTPIYRYIPEEFKQTEIEILTGVLNTGKPDTSYAEYHSESGETTYYESRIAPIYEKEEISSLLVISRDVTDRKQAEGALKESEEKYRRLVETSPDPIFIVDKKSDKIVDANETVTMLLGYTKDEIIGTRAGSRVASEQKKKFEKIFKEQKKTGIFQGEVELLRKDGSTVWVEPRSSSLGQYLMIFVRDITEHKKSEERLKRRLMKFKLEGGSLYLVKEPIPDFSIEALKDLLKVGYKGVVISRTPEKKTKTTFEGDVKFLWVSERGGKKSIAPNLKKIEDWIEKLPGKSAVLMDRLDYLVFKNGFEDTLSFVQGLKELAILNHYVVILSIDPSIFNKKELRLIEKETEEVEPLHKTTLSEDLLEILRFVYKENSKGVKPYYTNVQKEMGISKPTVRKRIHRLSLDGYLVEDVKGRFKVLKTTEKSQRFFLE